jgi:hypothetical protein
MKCDYVNCEKIINDSPEYMKPITVPMSIIGAVGGLCIIGGMFPMTYIIDTFRNVRYQYLRYYRKSHPFKQINLN